MRLALTRIEVHKEYVMQVNPAFKERLGIIFFFFQAEDGIRDQPRSRGLGDVYKRQADYSGI